MDIRQFILFKENIQRRPKKLKENGPQWTWFRGKNQSLFAMQLMGWSVRYICSDKNGFFSGKLVTSSGGSFENKDKNKKEIT